jgi:hypothetical protein
LRYVIWPFKRPFCNKEAMKNASSLKASKEFQLARADIAAARVRGGSSGYHRFLQIAYNSLESGEVKPAHVSKVMKLAQEGKHHYFDLQVALYSLKAPENMTA